MTPGSGRAGEGGALLIAAQSGRALAAAARRAGFRPYVADMFGDDDTLALTDAWQRLPGRFGRGAEGESVDAVLDELAKAAGDHPLGLVLGSGFEGAPHVVARLARRFRLLGASAETIRHLKDPFRLAALLADLGVPHPPLTADAVPDPAAWLSKRRGGSGGGHVRPAGPGAPLRGRYHQRRVPGRPVSIAFLADGRDALWVGASEQWTAPAPGRPYRFAGALEPISIGEGMRCEMEAALRAIVARTGLRGLAGADCLVEGGRWWLLEINPRPGGSLDVLDRRATPLLGRHVEACLGHLGAPEPPPARIAATRILYAGRPCVVPPAPWPDGVMDRTPAGSVIGPGDPVCTLWAEAGDRAGALAGLDRREAAVWAMFSGDGDHEYQTGGTPAPERERACGGAGR
ncbi:ATP-grasp domain-containing protein [Salinarimonas soli]|uniref:ATP-grasp domain-containing protein n=1 Tax=Salinarimonas soli TaxID=1638099 RepID=A0A5B2VG74_9HYPH|nr:ATP-grasp domain-containing protein [Salinarimonas soli]KAA2237500.1 ATP-grasp domain-containing protein [Salinarimonas soli]